MNHALTSRPFCCRQIAKIEIAVGRGLESTEVAMMSSFLAQVDSLDEARVESAHDLANWVLEILVKQG